MLSMIEKFSFISDYYGLFAKGLGLTLLCSFLASLIGLFIGIIAGVARISSNGIVRWIASAYVQIIRGIPLLVFLLYIYFGLGSIFEMSPFVAGVIGLGVFCGAYVAEIIRGGIQAIPKGQWEAAECLGLNYFHQLWFVILPQAFRSTLPALAGQFISLIKDSSLVSTISVMELTMVSKNIVTRTFYAIQVYTITALLYLILTYSLTKCVSYLEKKVVVYKI